MPFCSVIDCKYRNTRNSSLRIFQLPQGVQPFLVNQRRLWQHAIREANGGTGALLANPRVCAAHFISGKASSDFESPDFVPSVFPCTQEGNPRSQEFKTRSLEIKAHTQEIKTNSQENKTRTPESKTPTPERKTRSQESKTHPQESKTHTPERKTRSQESKSHPQESKTHTPERKTRSQVSKTRTPESKTHTPERRTRSQESKIYSHGIKTHTPESKTSTPERRTRSQESKTSTPKSKTSTPESKSHTPERRTHSQENKIYSQGIKTRSQESRMRIQQRENCKRKKNWTFYSRKRRHCRARSKRDDSALDLQPSALREAQSELSEEEQTSSSPSVLKEEETLADAEKVSFHSQTASRLNGIPPSLPADITALLKRPVLRLKRIVVPTDGFRCELCSETFTSSSLLEKHKELHDENSHFICEICGMRFTIQKEFTMHQSNHPKLEPYFPCNICDRSFSTVQLLKRHKLLHVKDGRKCPKCGTLFCQRHNHVLYLPRPKVKSESEGESEEDEAGGEESQEVKYDVIKKKDSPVKTEPVTETPVSANKTQLIIPPTNNPVVTVSVIPVLGVFRESPMASPRPPQIEVLPQISLKTAEPSPLPRPRPPPVLPPPPPVCPSSLPPPVLKHSSDDIHPSIQPKIEAPGPPAAEPFVPKCSDFPPSLKVFSPQYLTSALLEVKRNYEYIFNKPKRFKGIVKKEEEEPLPISSQKRLTKPGMRRRVAYDLEVVL